MPFISTFIISCIALENMTYNWGDIACDRDTFTLQQYHFVSPGVIIVLKYNSFIIGNSFEVTVVIHT